MIAFVWLASIFLYLFLATVFYELTLARAEWDDEMAICVAAFWPIFVPIYLAYWVLGTF